ncbi:MAG: GNAT family N-acetyltransferase [Betaproteobacteria bacterium]|nr:GNAT family N-acetyltransferase [Betaproteobacteria bacterium]MDE2003594.1 GNAT family N-acetyltransferase [Betaproteobacteria bacterium]MDE2208317.1 GNAT family N-acetyltransferase [Betaproteobacteria bacterium]MDE2359341.1 GNAT family N-acetyltransferase [Betaproteobacteria bacterium]
MKPPANIAWHALTGPQARHATGAGGVRRYAPGLSPIVAFASVERPDVDALAPYCEPGEQLYCAEWKGDAPDGWRVEAESTMYQMVWEAPMPTVDEALPALQLAPGHAQSMLDLADLTHPGPFGPRTVELGEYFGVFDRRRLVAMAGERMHASGFREISGVCTHPGFQGRGLARRLVATLVRRQLLRSEIPFLHVMRDNVSAHHLYEGMGFRDHREIAVRIVSRCGDRTPTDPGILCTP